LLTAATRSLRPGAIASLSMTDSHEV
jgi:hypothetical protein